MKDLVLELDKWFSLYVRCRYANPHTGMVHCFTCSRYFHYKNMDCGHFLRRGHWKLRFDKDNARAQCHICNRERNGMPEVFEEELRSELGNKIVDGLFAVKHNEARFDDNWYKRKIELLKSTVKEMPAYTTMV